jgi:hypothetical protein
LAILASRLGRRTPAYVSPDARIYAALEPLSGSHRVWGGLAPDYTLSEAQEVLKSQHAAEHLAVGVAGYKLDECDGSELTGASWMFPAHATFPSGRDGEQMRQVYGLLLQKIPHGLFHERDRRTYGLVRASLAGAAALRALLRPLRPPPVRAGALQRQLQRPALDAGDPRCPRRRGLGPPDAL